MFVTSHFMAFLLLFLCGCFGRFVATSSSVLGGLSIFLEESFSSIPNFRVAFELSPALLWLAVSSLAETYTKDGLSGCRYTVI